MIETPNVAGVSIVESSYPPGQRFRPHCDRRSRVSIVLSGSLREVALGREVHATAASVVVKPTDVRHCNVFGDAGARVLSILSPCALLDGYDAGPAGRLDRWRWYHTGPPAAAALRLVRAIRWTPGDVVDGLWGLMGEILTSDAERDPASPPPWLLRTKEELDDAFDQKPTVRALAAAAGVHPVYLSRAFRRHFGCAVTTYRRRLRVRAAAAELAATPTPAAQIALAVGFADQSHMCRDFQTELGISPGRLRVLLQRP